MAESQLQKTQDEHKKEISEKAQEISQLQQNLESESGSKAQLEGQIKSKEEEIKEMGNKS